MELSGKRNLSRIDTWWLISGHEVGVFGIEEGVVGELNRSFVSHHSLAFVRFSNSLLCLVLFFSVSHFNSIPFRVT